ncbi:hypothetical protein [Hydrogenimonas sp.]|uniref:hypothetical protein n=1 Tax=Hydrogenimonas sp. TaxID=2231112 RepID=UPI00261439F0|nr:hypothetical protein [Hydrogenimonas sp.]
MEKVSDEELERTIEILKKAYKKEKEKLEWAENDFEESLVVEEMERFKKEIKRLKRELDARRDKEISS